ncbi:GntR family transcriptional regulator [Herbaspirillum sp. RV1423]|uniref:GntR family transcriptional regulator n=1 Tax=Herbaspirillum sp. RV1423 TaxID=1443993 RepID=UPI0004B057DB|nr:GntR family transcriptional regulator [Herbaspirillum sp. RV1423]
MDNIAPLNSTADRAGTYEKTDKTLSQRVYRLIRADLLAGTIQPGQKLILRDLQKRYAQGISPIREALILLASEGLLEGEGQKGFRVASISIDELMDLAATRQKIEKLMLEASINAGDADWEGRVVASHHALSKTPLPEDMQDQDAIQLWESRHRAFHQALLSACDSPWLQKIYAQLSAHTERYRLIRLFHSPAHIHLEVDVDLQHREIMDASLKRDVPEATRLLGEHIAKTTELVKRLWQSGMEDNAGTGDIL